MVAMAIRLPGVSLTVTPFPIGSGSMSVCQRVLKALPRGYLMAIGPSCSSEVYMRLRIIRSSEGEATAIPGMHCR